MLWEHFSLTLDRCKFSDIDFLLTPVSDVSLVKPRRSVPTQGLKVEQ